MEEKPFIDRKKELASLEKAIRRKGPELIIVYGRRRIGKSRLLKELSKKEKIKIYVMLEDADYQTNLRKVSEAISELFNYPSFHPKSFREVFVNLPKDTIIVLDEFSYMGTAIGEFQGIWEEIAKEKNLKIILSGSLIRVMEDLNYSIRSPLYGRASEIIKLGPLKIKDAYEWYKNEKITDILEIYFVAGGIPRYLEILKKREDIETAFFSRNGLLLREGKLLLKESFPGSQIYPKILNSMASGNTKAINIANDINIKAGEISKYLSVLEDYGYTQKRMPVLGGGKKDVRFYLKDSFFAFWSKFVWPRYSNLESGDEKNPNFDQRFTEFCGLRFEELIIELMIEHNYPDFFEYEKIGNLTGNIKNGKIHGKDKYEIDAVAINEKTKEILFVECKWKDDVDCNELLEDLKKKSEYVEWNKNSRRDHYAIFAKSFKKKIKNCFDLNDIDAFLRKN